MTPNTVALIPAFNEAATIRGIAERTLAVCPHLIIVDDGSSDGTAEALQGLPLTLIRNDSNMGKAASLWRGMEAALQQGAEAVITLDGDGQHLPEDIPRFMEAAREHPGHMIIGSRLWDRAAFPPKRYWANRVANFWISWAAGYAIEDSQSGFRLYPARLLQTLRPMQARHQGFVFESEVFIAGAAVGIHSYPIQIAAIYEENARPSHFRGVTDILHITRMVAGRLLRGFLCLPGFYRAFIRPHLFTRQRVGSICPDGWFTLLLSLLVMLCTLGMSLAWVFFRSWQSARNAGVCDGDVDCVLVLGMKLHEGRISAAYRQRLERARSLRPRRLLLLGGVTSRNSPSEAEAGARYLRGQGLAEASLVVEDSSRHTLENLQRARALLGAQDCDTAVLVSSRYHLYRSQEMARGLGLPVTPCAAEDHYRPGPGMWLRLLQEAFFSHWYLTGRAWGRLTGNSRIQGKIG